MRIEYLQYLLEVDRCHSITQAAKNLYISQPALSAALNSMESELGYPIIKRSKSGTLPTVRGLQIIQDAKTIIALSNKWYEENETESEVSGKLDIIALPSIATAILVDAIIQFKHKFPSVEVHLYEEKIKGVEKILQTTVTNLCFSFTFPEKQSFIETMAKKNGWQIDWLYSDHFAVMINANHPLADKPVLSQGDLRQLDFTGYTEDSDEIAERLSKMTKKDIGVFFTNPEHIRRLVAENLAVSFCPYSTSLKDYNVINGKIKVKEIEDFYFPITYYCFYPKMQSLSAAEKAFIQCVKNYCTSIEKISDS